MPKSKRKVEVNSASSLEHIAEDLIAHVLQRNRVLIAKPKFDHNGADLLALLDVFDGAKFCRIQCKGRSLVSSKSSHLEIPAHYVTDGLVVVLYIDDVDDRIFGKNMFCFFGKDIRQWSLNGKNEYTLSFTKNIYEKKFGQYRFNDKTVHEIIKAICDINVLGEFKTMEHGYAELTGFVSTVSGSAS